MYESIKLLLAFLVNLSKYNNQFNRLFGLGVMVMDLFIILGVVNFN